MANPVLIPGYTAGIWNGEIIKRMTDLRLVKLAREYTVLYDTLTPPISLSKELMRRDIPVQVWYNEIING